MSFHLRIGIRVLTSGLFAIAAAVCIAMSGMLISELNGRVDVLRLARWQMIAAALMTGIVSLALGGWRHVEIWHIGYLALSGFFGIIVASTTYFAAIYTAGARNTALMFSLTAPFALLLGYVFLGETISSQQMAGVVLVLTGILMAIGAQSRRAVDAKAAAVPWYGIAFGVITALGQALGSLVARPAMADGVEPFTAMTIRAGVAALFYIALLAVPLAILHKPHRFEARSLGIAIAAAFFGTGLGMSLLMAALAEGNVGIVSTLSSMTPVVILPMVWARTRIAPPPMAWAGASLAVAGTGLISIPGLF